MFPVNVPNVLTLARILLIPVLLVALLGEFERGDLIAAIVFAVASVTDAFDGWYARRSGSVTNFGKLMDPIADKIMVIGALLALVSLDRLAAWVAMVIIAREVAVTFTRMQATQQGVIIPANWWGKAKTIVQVVVILLVIALDPTPGWIDGLIYAMVAITVASGVDYFFGLRRQMGAARAAGSDGAIEAIAGHDRQ